ncbi:MAG: DUF255 domain-containing protein [Verrucomicrobiales bacterium]
MMLIPKGYLAVLGGVALFLVGACSPRTVEKTAGGADTPAAPLPTGNLFADAAVASTPFLAQYSKSSIPWQPWSEKSLEAAKASQRPILIHFGYSTCPFTRRLRLEVLEDEKLVAFFRDNFVCVVADSEDSVSLNQLLLDSLPRLGTAPAWPMLVWMDAEGRPYHAHDFTATNGFSIEAILTTAKGALSSWKFGNGYATRLGEEVLQKAAPTLGVPPNPAPSDLQLLDETRYMLTSIHDPAHGTLCVGQNFPRPNSIHLALSLSESHPKDSFQRQELRDIVRVCLKAMREGAILDPLDRCFHRYSEKPNWNAPHSEKMLVDQACIASAYLEAARVLGEADLATTAFDTLDAVLTGWKTADGLYLHAKTAFVPPGWPQSPPFLAPWFIWSASELKDLLDETEESVVFKVHGIRERGNMPPAIYSPRFGSSANVLGIAVPTDKAAAELGMDRAALLAVLARAHTKMSETRDKRPGLFIDERATVSGNALLLATLAQAARAPGGERFGEPAAALAEQLLSRAIAADGKVLASGWWRSAPLPGAPGLTDHATLLMGLLEWNATRPNPETTARIPGLLTAIRTGFLDSDTQAYRSSRAEELIPGQHAWFAIRDTSIPADIALMATNLRLLSKFTGDKAYHEQRKDLFALLLRLPSQWTSAHSLLAELAIDHQSGNSPN